MNPVLNFSFFCFKTKGHQQNFIFLLIDYFITNKIRGKSMHLHTNILTLIPQPVHGFQCEVGQVNTRFYQR